MTGKTYDLVVSVLIARSNELLREIEEIEPVLNKFIREADKLLKTLKR